MRTKKWLALLLPLLAAGISIVIFPLSSALRPGLSTSEISLLSFSAAASIMYIGCSLLFLLGLKNFTAKLKIAYTVFCVGLILFALSELQVPIAALLGPSGAAWLVSAGLLVPILVGVGCMYIGVKLFADLFNVHSKWGKPWLVGIISLVAAAAAYSLPVGPYASTLEAAKGSNGLLSLIFVLFVAAAILCFRMQQRATATYRSALKWFCLALLGFAAAAVITIGAIVTVGSKSSVMTAGYSILLEALLALLLLKSAYEFDTIGALSADTAPKTPKGTIDVIVAVAQLASNAQAIDPLLDNLRRISSTTGPGQRLSEADEASLRATYQDIERYLIEKEPVRRYSKEEVRHYLRAKLHITGPVFFDNLP